MQINIEEWFESRYLKFPIIRHALMEYWITMYNITKEIKPENIRSVDVFKPLLDCSIGYEDPQYNNGIEGWQVKFFSGNYSEKHEYRTKMESAIKNLLEKIPDITMIQSSVDITPFLGHTPVLQFLSLTSCKSTKSFSSIIGLCSLKKLHTLKFRSCLDLEQIPLEIGNLPDLKSLVFDDCPNLKEIPNEIGNLPNLRELKISSCENLQPLPESICQIPTLFKIVSISQPDDFVIPCCLEPYISEKWYGKFEDLNITSEKK